MSGTEAIAVLSLIGTIIQIVDGTNQVYDAAKDAQGLPVAFREVQARLPTVKSLLVSVQTELWERRIDESVCKIARPLASACEEKVRQLDDVFRKAIPAEGTSNLAQWYRAVRTTRSDKKVKRLMEGILADVQLLVGENNLRSATKEQQEQILQAIKEVSELPEHEPEDETMVFNNFGSGTFYQAYQQTNFSGQSTQNSGPVTYSR
jgi:hypothetical protein